MVVMPCCFIFWISAWLIPTSCSLSISKSSCMNARDQVLQLVDWYQQVFFFINVLVGNCLVLHLDWQGKCDTLFVSETFDLRDIFAVQNGEWGGIEQMGSMRVSIALEIGFGDCLVCESCIIYTSQYYMSVYSIHERNEWDARKHLEYTAKSV